MSKKESLKIDSPKKSNAFPIGAKLYPDGVNFCVYSKNATAVDLLLFNKNNDAKPSTTIKMDPQKDKTYFYWHVFVPGIKAGQIYGFNVSGPYEPERGRLFDSDKVMLDPYGLAVTVPDKYSRIKSSQAGKNTASAMKSVIADTSAYDWEGDSQLGIPFTRTVIYEMHVKGFTANPNSGVSKNKRGTYHGVIEKIGYLKDLGISAVELLPVYQFDEQDAAPGFKNYWGYAPVSFFAPHAAYSTNNDPLEALNEFRDMVKALHRAGIEVILDVVYNHTAEGGSDGPTLSFRGFENSAYYILDENNKSVFANYTGCGNTLNANHPVVRRMIIDSLHYWVKEMHVDGFRFDLASILTRDESGNPMANPPILWDIESDPIMAGIKLIAEAWDAAGLYQVGSFIGDSWKEWNGRFRDDVRSFFIGDKNTVSKFATRLIGSPDIYHHKDQAPEQSINFITCHDGFTLNDLVSYNSKHNELNGEENRDGSDNNFSWNFGIEGPTSDMEIEKSRNRMVKNFLLANLVAFGTPMLLMGDEVRRTQSGNNNSYCQDNITNWFNWDNLKKYQDIYRFARTLINFRFRRDVAVEDPNLTLSDFLDSSSFHWHGIKLWQPDWGEDSHCIALNIISFRGNYTFHFMMNAYWEPLEFEIPPVTESFNSGWKRWIDTYLESPEDILDAPNTAPSIKINSYLVQPRSIVVLIAGKKRPVK